MTHLSSDLSGDSLAGSDDPAEIKVRFPDGSERVLTVSAAEADALSLKGTEARHRRWPARVWAALAKHPWKTFVVAFVTLLSTYATVVLIPGLADRREQLELNSALVTEISDAIAVTMSSGRVILRDRLAESAVRDRARTLLRTAEEDATKDDGPRGAAITRDEQAKINKAEDRLADADLAAWRAELDLYNETRSAWIKAGSSVEVRLRVYFGDTGLPRGFAEFREIVLTHLDRSLTKLSQDVVSAKRILNYVCDKFEFDDAIQPEANQIQVMCDKHNDGNTPVGTSFNWVAIGNELIRINARTVETLVGVNARGFRGSIWHPF